ncbi:hypothetical protein [Vulcanisaeta souniana]|uniref:hypothetical protein n=1 Tax=Vulcanisaeta souniana TaxID=164452 RepID=UPI0006D15FB3|nr:hypothetical protein [Vulcanisaeta souniana]
MVKVIVECLSQLPDADKLRNLITLASMRVKPHGRSMIEIIDDVWMNINVRDAGYVELRAWRRRLEDARAIQEALRRAGYEAKLREARGGFEIYINKGQAKRSPELLIKICGALRKMYEDAISENNERKAEKIARAIITLNCPVPCSGSTRLKILLFECVFHLELALSRNDLFSLRDENTGVGIAVSTDPSTPQGTEGIKLRIKNGRIIVGLGFGGEGQGNEHTVVKLVSQLLDIPMEWITYEYLPSNESPEPLGRVVVVWLYSRQVRCSVQLRS